jgi:stearoyl-CoA desaturase (Delta-9 desaturase)
MNERVVSLDDASGRVLRLARSETMHELPLRRRLGNLIAVAVPFAGFTAALLISWHSFVGPTELAILFLMYTLSALGTTIGFHRLLTHRSFQTHRGLEYLFAILGSLSAEAPVIRWVAVHRKHHACADHHGDPHSPYGFGSGLGASLRGLWHAHVGWLFTRDERPDAKRYASELVEDRGMVLISRAFPAIVVAGLLVPSLLGYLLAGLQGAFTGFLWGGLARIFLFHHVSFSVNSVCHFFGRRRFDTEDRSTNVFWLAVPSMGEAWHNNHHAFPRSASHGLRRWELDISALAIRAMRWAGIAWNVVEIPAESQRQKEAGNWSRSRRGVDRSDSPLV